VRARDAWTGRKPIGRPANNRLARHFRRRQLWAPIGGSCDIPAGKARL